MSPASGFQVLPVCCILTPRDLCNCHTVNMMIPKYRNCIDPSPKNIGDSFHSPICYPQHHGPADPRGGSAVNVDISGWIDTLGVEYLQGLEAITAGSPLISGVGGGAEGDGRMPIGHNNNHNGKDQPCCDLKLESYIGKQGASGCCPRSARCPTQRQSPRRPSVAPALQLGENVAIKIQYNYVCAVHVPANKLSCLCSFMCYVGFVVVSLHSGAREKRPGIWFPPKDISAHREVCQMSVDPILPYMHICEGSFQCFRSRFSDMSGVGSIYFF